MFTLVGAQKSFWCAMVKNPIVALSVTARRLVGHTQSMKGVIVMSKVHTWQMTEEQRLAYIEKYPIKLCGDAALVKKIQSRAQYMPDSMREGEKNA